MRNRAPLPRTAGLRTLSELTSGLKGAGLDPSRIQERAMNLAKVAGEKRKRAREEEEAQMDIDEGSGSEGGDDQWMDVDGEESSPNKRVKSNSGAVMAKGARGPKSNRQLAGMRDDAVSSEHSLNGIGQGLLINRVSTASDQSYQAAESRAERTEYARKGWRKRPCDQSQNGGYFPL